jgi:prepilin-type N-terminal cleavage/methylation domain-containing protein/prepilin-type processing-associated H-X9-DG protein
VRDEQAVHFWATSARRRRPGGFTLIELLVVVAIIALLISILLPSLHSARDQTKAVVCGTQLKQMGGAYEMYFMDNGDRLFPYESHGLAYRWLRPILSEVDEIMLCPSTKPMNRSQKDATLWHGAPSSGREAWCWAAAGAPSPPQGEPPDPRLYGDGSYTFNGWLFDPQNTWHGIAYTYQVTDEMTAGDHPYHFKRRAAIKTPALSPLMLDGFEMLIYPVNESGSTPLKFNWPTNVLLSDLSAPRDIHRYDGGRSVFTPWEQQLFRVMPKRHPKYRSQTVFMDGHVEALHPRKVIELDWGPKFERGDHNRRPINWPL